MLLKQFDQPHRQIHGTAEKVMRLKNEQKGKEALALIEATWQGELQVMIRLFEAIKDDITQAYRDSRREIALVFEDSRGRYALIVDEVISVEHLNEQQMVSQLMPCALAEGIEFAIGKRVSDGRLVLMLPNLAALHGECVNSDSLQPETTA
jgi:hypothetical protein